LIVKTAQQPVKKVSYLMVTSMLLSFCSPQEKITQLESQNDSLRQALLTSETMLYTMQEVGTLIDSIDASRHALRVNLVEGIQAGSYTERLEEINQYVKRSHDKITGLEAALRESHNESSAYQMMISALKDELSIAADEIRALEARVAAVMKDNTNLKQTVKVQEASLEDFHLQLEAKYNEVKLLSLHIEELTAKLKITEAEAFYAQAQSLELAANRTKLAPRKKKETYQQALDLYKKALEAGKTEAREGIQRLEKLV
jgi:chromosome segregation ATPase